jgi:hypothetical protein
MLTNTQKFRAILKTKSHRSEKLAPLEVLSHYGLVRYDDLEGVFGE